MSAAECKICLRPYNEEDLIPRILTSCGHTICQQCATILSTDGRMIVCPFDRKITHFNRSDGVTGLQRNFALLELSREPNPEQEKSSGKEADVPCFENPSHEAVLYCQQCQVDLCDSCFTSVHKSKSLSSHQKINISEKPIKLPKCPKHPHNIAEFLCTDPNCTNPTKIMCQTCVLFDQHKSHKYDFLVEQLLKNERTLKDLLEKHEKHQRKGKELIETIKTSLESFEVPGLAFKDVALSRQLVLLEPVNWFCLKISEEFDIRKKEALHKLAVFVNDTRMLQTAFKKRLEDEYSRSKEVKKQIEKKLKMKNDLQNTDEITNWENSQMSWDASPTEIEGLHNQKFILLAMELYIRSSSVYDEFMKTITQKSCKFVCFQPE